MASAWLDIAVDWEDPKGWNLSELLKILIEAYNERPALSVNNAFVMPALLPYVLESPQVVDDVFLNNLNDRFELYLLSSQNIKTEVQADYINWTKDEFLTYYSFPLDLIPLDFSCYVFDWRWVTYWFYILNETLLMKTSNGGNSSSVKKPYKKTQNSETNSYADALASFSAEPYTSENARYIVGQYDYRSDYDPNPTIDEDHVISASGVPNYQTTTRDQNLALYPIPLNTYFRFFKNSGVGGSDNMTWNFSEGDILLDITSDSFWTGSSWDNLPVNPPEVTPTIDAKTLYPYPSEAFHPHYWGTSNVLYNGLGSRFVTNLNDENLITYTPIV
jgi:hypothetical protein